MRVLPLAAALLLVACVPAAEAGSSSVRLEGPESVRAERATTANLRVVMVLEGVVCTGAAEIPVSLRVAEAVGLRSAELALEEVSFDLAGHEALAGAWRGEAEVPLTLWADGAGGLVRLRADYALPSHCVVPAGATSGATALTMRVEGEGSEAPAPVRAAAPRIAPPAPAPAPAAAADDALPLPVLGAIAGTLVGGAVVAVKRLRAAGA